MNSDSHSWKVAGPAPAEQSGKLGLGPAVMHRGMPTSQPSLNPPSLSLLRASTRNLLPVSGEDRDQDEVGLMEGEEDSPVLCLTEPQDKCAVDFWAVKQIFSSLSKVCCQESLSGSL